MTDARRIIEQSLKAKGQSMSWLSKQLGRNHAYIHQYLNTHTPSDLEFKDKIKISQLLNIPLKDLGVDLPGAPAAPAGGGFAEDIEAFTPAPGSPMAASPNVARFKVRSNAMDRHDLLIRSGDIVEADISQVAIDGLASGQAVIVQLYHKPDCMTATTVIRQYIAPGLLITNSSGSNSIIRMDDDSLPFEPVIKGCITAVVRLARN